VVNSESAYGYSERVLSGFLRVVTHSKVFEQPSSIGVALAFAEQIRTAPQAVCLAPGKNHWKLFVRYMEAISAQGNDVPDAIIIQGRISAVRAGALTRGNLGSWAYLYNRYLGTGLPSKIYLGGSTVSYPYFNAGLVSFDQDTGFGNSWLDLACQIDYDPKVKDKRPWLDQLFCQ
jgi:hypothetical protein